jgi:hypothetical protein
VAAAVFAFARPALGAGFSARIFARFHFAVRRGIFATMNLSSEQRTR